MIETITALVSAVSLTVAYLLGYWRGTKDSYKDRLAIWYEIHGGRRNDDLDFLANLQAQTEPTPEQERTDPEARVRP